MLTNPQLNCKTLGRHYIRHFLASILLRCRLLLTAAENKRAAETSQAPARPISEPRKLQCPANCGSWVKAVKLVQGFSCGFQLAQVKVGFDQVIANRKAM
jgi:hypothetical protein